MESKAAAPMLRTILNQDVVPLRKFALRLTGNRADAEDLLQDVFERAMRLAPSNLDAQELRAWILRVMRNLFLDQYRKCCARAHAIESLRIELGELLAEPEQPLPLWRQVDMNTVNEAIARLDPPFREVIQLSLSTPSQAQIAESLNLRPTTVRTRLLRARNKLRAVLLESMAFQMTGYQVADHSYSRNALEGSPGGH